MSGCFIDNNQEKTEIETSEAIMIFWSLFISNHFNDRKYDIDFNSNIFIRQKEEFKISPINIENLK